MVFVKFVYNMIFNVHMKYLISILKEAATSKCSDPGQKVGR